MTIIPDATTLQMIADIHDLPPTPNQWSHPGCKGRCASLYPERKVNKRGREGWLKCSRCRFWTVTTDHRCGCCNCQFSRKAKTGNKSK